jgi:hypothetical protein
MSFNFKEYLYNQKKKRNCFDFFRYKYLICKRRGVFEKIKKALRVLWEIIYYGFIYLLGTGIIYNDYNDVKVPQFLLTLILIALLSQHKSSKEDYKYWENKACDNNFYERFIKRYRMQPFLPIIIIVFIFARYCSVGTFIILYIIIVSYDLWDRRYITTDIKNDMILEKLNQTRF